MHLRWKASVVPLGVRPGQVGRAAALVLLCASTFGCSRSTQQSGLLVDDPSSCTDRGIAYEDGQVWPCDRDCGSCRCDDGRVRPNPSACNALGPPAFSETNGSLPASPLEPPPIPGDPVASLGCNAGETPFPSDTSCFGEATGCRQLLPNLWCGVQVQCCAAEAQCLPDEETYESAAACADAAGRNRCRLESICCSTVYCAPPPGTPWGPNMNITDAGTDIGVDDDAGI